MTYREKGVIVIAIGGTMNKIHSFETIGLGELISRGVTPDVDPAEGPGTSVPQSADMQKCPVVLVVDDERLIADTLAVILKHQGYAATAVYCGEDALRLALDISPDLVISDVMMPDISGIDLGIKLKESLPNCKVLLFSGHAHALDHKLEAVRQRGYEFKLLSKPVAPTVLLDEINQLGVQKPETDAV